jgi:hypothetical protein
VQAILPLLCLTSLLALAPGEPLQTTRPNATTARQSMSADLFPVPREGFTIRVDREKASSMSVTEMLDEFTRVTGIAVQMDNETDAAARRTPVGVNRSLEVPASEVYRIVETLLRARDFVTVHLSDVEPRIWRVQSVFAVGGRGGSLRSDARIVPEDELGAWVDHPATLITVTLSLPSTDVRTLSNSMRTMFTDANTQNIIPVGDGSLMITGFAREVHALVRMLHQIDELASADRDRAQTAPEQPKRQ